MNIEVKAYGDKAFLIGIKEHKPYEVLASLKDLFPEGQVRAGMETALISFNSPGYSVAKVEERLKDIKLTPINVKGKEIIVPVEYNGEDLSLVGKALNISELEVVELHKSITWSVALIGFAPGFPYLLPDKATALDQVTRLDSPRSKVPAGSVALAAGMSCIYPKYMPGGWHLIGTTEVQLFDPTNQAQPTLLSVGDTVRFTSK